MANAQANGGTIVCELIGGTCAVPEMALHVGLKAGRYLYCDKSAWRAAWLGTACARWCTCTLALALRRIKFVKLVVRAAAGLGKLERVEDVACGEDPRAAPR